MPRLTLVSNTAGPAEFEAEPHLPCVADQILFAPTPTWPTRVPRDTCHTSQLELFPVILSRKPDRQIASESCAKIIASDFKKPSNKRKYPAQDTLENVKQFGNYVSRRKITALRYHFSSLTARHFELDDLTNKLRESKITLVGDVVQLSREELKAIGGASDAEIDLVVEILGSFGLTLGKRVPGWDAETHRR